MKRIILSMAIIAGVIFSTSAQKTYVDLKCNADQIIKWWNNRPKQP